MLYGLCRGMRSTRKLQEACCYRLDFLWQIDYITFAKFRTRFGPQLKDLFRQLGHLAMNLGLIYRCGACKGCSMPPRAPA